MSDTIPEAVASPSAKRQRKSSPTQKNAFDVMLDYSKLCWSSRDAPSSTSILEIVASNGWFSWHDNETNGQNPDYSNLR